MLTLFRHIPERPRDPAHWDTMKLITAQSAVNVPLIVNGDVFKYSDIARVKEETGISFQYLDLQSRSFFCYDC